MTIATARPDDVPVVIRVGTAEDLPSIQGAWLAMYQHMTSNGMLLDVSGEGFQQWASSIAPILGRFACMFIAEEAGEIVGFIVARIRLLPPHFGGFQVGSITEIFTDNAHRRRGIGRRLLDSATQWFTHRDIKRIELLVLSNNSAARKFYADLGWQEELVQMVWQGKGTNG
jgi:ribosomal protein S18 acetylase RimI-like enzyme